MENKEFELDGRVVNVLIDYDNNEVWLSQKEMSVLYCKFINAINRYINGLNNIETSSVINKNEITEKIFAITGLDGKTYNVKHYNLDIILQVGYKCNYDITVRFKEWVDSLFNDNKNLIAQNKWLNGANNYEIVKFESGNLSLDINVSPSEDTVWLSVIDMALLFDRDEKTIRKHIDNALLEECFGATVSKFATVQIEGNRKVKREIEYYNLDVVVSVGYRVKSKRGIEFRRWANNILKQYLIKGYAINNKRCLEHSDILVSLSDDINEIKNKVNKHEEFINNINKIFYDKHYLIKNGERIESDIAYQEIYKKAYESIYIIDDYINIKTLQLLKCCNKNIKIIIVSDNKSIDGIKDEYLMDFKKDTNIDIKVKKNNGLFHSRYIVIDYKTDNYKLFFCGGSSKDGGNKINTIVEIED
ncbi:MAG: virulence RhuM family protein, partial [Acholeplasmatales bacterium]|nr:virulence RhuM family protein [Acholeplasmatales bacterium]